MKKLVCFVIGAFIVSAICFAGENLNLYKASPEVNQQSIAKAKATEKNKPTKKLIMDKVRKAAKLLEKEGAKAFPKFNGKNSEFLFSGTYVWVHDLEGRMRMHPIKPKMASGKSLLFLKDKKGNAIFVGMNKIAVEKGEGWYQYVWPKPGEKEASPKLSFVKKVKSKDGETLVLGCGAYNSDF